MTNLSGQDAKGGFVVHYIIRHFDRCLACGSLSIGGQISFAVVKTIINLLLEDLSCARTKD